jgi:hypothetical protein
MCPGCGPAYAWGLVVRERWAGAGHASLPRQGRWHLCEVISRGDGRGANSGANRRGAPRNAPNGRGRAHWRMPGRGSPRAAARAIARQTRRSTVLRLGRGCGAARRARARPRAAGREVPVHMTLAGPTVSYLVPPRRSGRVRGVAARATRRLAHAAGAGIAAGRLTASQWSPGRAPGRAPRAANGADGLDGWTERAAPQY